MKVLIEIGSLTEDEVALALKHITIGKTEGFGSVLFRFFNFRISDIQHTTNENHEAIKAVYR